MTARRNETVTETEKGQRGHAHEANFGVKGVVWGVFIRWSRAFKVQKMGQIPEWDSVLI